MTSKTTQLALDTGNKETLLTMKKLAYLGSGTYECQLHVNSNGFMCVRPFSFDNDEYFLAKLKEMLMNHSGEADLMALESENYLRFQPYGQQTVLVSGLIMEDQPLAQSLEFAFAVPETNVAHFIAEFEKLVRNNI